MADDATATATVTFRRNHLVRLRGFNHAALDGKLVRIKSEVINEVNSKFEVAFLDDQARPPVPVIPARRMLIKPDNMRHACEYCLVVASAAVDGGRLQMCGRCKTARYCNAECQRADWARHKGQDCVHFSHYRSGDMSSLLQACGTGNVTEVRRLVEEEGADVDKATSNGPTPMATAAYNGHMSVVRYLVEQGADVDKARATSFTPLNMAAQNGHMVIVQYLCEHGADIEKVGEQGATPLSMAAQNNFFTMLQYLVEQGADKDKADGIGRTPIFMAAKNGEIMAVRYLLEQGADKDKAADGGASPLFIAALTNHLAVVRCLVEQGADKDKAANNGMTPLSVAQSKGHTEVAAYLRAAGAR